MGKALPPEVTAFAEHLLVARGMSPNTLAAYKRDVAAFMAFTENRIAVDGKTVEGFLAHLTKQGHGARSNARRLSALRTFYRYLLESGVVVDDPTAAVASPKLPKSLPKALSGAEMKRLLETAEGGRPEQVRLRVIFYLLYAAGLRVSELVSLTVADVEDAAADGLLRVTGKGGKTRLVPLGEKALAVVGDYLRGARPVLAGAASKWLLPSPQKGKALTRQRVFQLIQAAGRMVEVNVAPHHLRHTFATHLLEHDADLRAVQLMLGHASLNTTQIYTKVAGTTLREALETYHPLSGGGQRTR
ncbi:MAG: tyrosine recombinase [Pseudomonadaceae bacterium]|nr:tyrosine recombinase [Pseudomonadaceae bacterium]